MNKKANILVVDDSENMLEIIRRNLSSGGYVVYTVTNVMDAISFLESTELIL
jgi:CheY-like chemotaxis protein